MTILKDLWEKIKGVKDDLVLAGIIILLVLFSFGLGRLSKIEERKTPITIEKAESAQDELSAPISTSETFYIASKNGTKYYLPWCSGVSKINLANLVKFKTEREAKMAGLERASGCVFD